MRNAISAKFIYSAWSNRSRAEKVKYQRKSVPRRLSAGKDEKKFFFGLLNVFVGRRRRLEKKRNKFFVQL